MHIVIQHVLVLQAAKQIKQLYELFLKVDATQVEINPFAETPDGRGRCLCLIVIRKVNYRFRFMNQTSVCSKHISIFLVYSL
jgi:succinyl-CoA synthetase beta subunit